MTKELKKEVMKRSKLENEFNANRNHEYWCSFKFQWNYCVSLLRKTKKQYYENYENCIVIIIIITISIIIIIIIIIIIMKTVKPYFSDKGSNCRRITLLKNDSLLTDDKDIAETMHTFFVNITEYLNLKLHKESFLTDINGITSNFDNHISVKKIRESFPNIVSSTFNFQEISRDDVQKEIISLNVKKSSSTMSTISINKIIILAQRKRYLLAFPRVPLMDLFYLVYL